MKLTAKQQAAIDSVIEDFKNGSVAGKVAAVTFDLPQDIPSANWTLSNRWLAYLTTGSVDARTFNQWKKVKRFVRKGSKAGYIWRPRIIRVKDSDGNDTDETRCIGFVPVAVFGYSSTDGQDLPETPQVPENLPLAEVAEAWGVNVRADWFDGTAYGSCKVDGSQITLNCSAPRTFWHELAHVAHGRVKAARGEKLNGGQDTWQEIVAEFSAEIIRRTVDNDAPDTSGNTYEYIRHYAAREGLDVAGACLKALRDAGQVVSLILDAAREAREAKAA